MKKAVLNVLFFFFRFEPYVDDRYKEFCKDQGKAEDVSVLVILLHVLVSCIAAWQGEINLNRTWGNAVSVIKYFTRNLKW